MRGFSIGHLPPATRDSLHPASDKPSEPGFPPKTALEQPTVCSRATGHSKLGHRSAATKHALPLAPAAYGSKASIRATTAPELPPSAPGQNPYRQYRRSRMFVSRITGILGFQGFSALLSDQIYPEQHPRHIPTFGQEG
jgi:hypothetical protein